MRKIFITRKIPSIAKELLQKHFEVWEYEKDRNISKEELKEVVQSFEGILSMYCDPLDEQVLSCATHLKAISNYAIGLNNIDVEYARKKNIAVFNLPDIVTHSTADLTFAILLSLVRKICEAKKFVMQGKWTQWSPDLFLGEELFSKTWGIIGFGRTGQAVAKRALGFGLNVLFYNRSQKDYPHVKQVDLEALYANSDYISLHLPLNKETKYLLDKNAFLKMKKKPVLVNMARGAVVKTEDLVLALEKKWIRGAALDVADPEPIGEKHPLFAFSNCLIVPHIGTSTVDCRYQMAKKAAENLISFLV